MYDPSKYKELPEDIRHEMKAIASIGTFLMHGERKSRKQVLINKLVQRSFDLIEKVTLEKL